MLELDSLRFSEIIASGDERISYLQGQLTQDLSAAATSRSLLLAPSGEVLTDISLSIKPDYVRLVVPTELVDVALVRLRRFVLRSKVAFELRGDAAPPMAIDQLISTPWPSSAEWALALPPHSFGRTVVDSTISFTKGCFTGQELVGRADARGATMPWRFVAGHGGQVDAVHEWLCSYGPEGPKGVTSGVVVADDLSWRGIAHRTLEVEMAKSIGADLVYMA